MAYQDPKHTHHHVDPHTRQLWAKEAREKGRPLGCMVMFLWALFIGSWITLVGTLLAWLLVITGVGTPAGLRLLGRLPGWAFPGLPGLRFLEDVQQAVEAIESDAEYQVHPGVRIAYTILIGWWASLLALLLAWVLTMTLYGLPAAQRVQCRVPRFATLARYDAPR